MARAEQQLDVVGNASGVDVHGVQLIGAQAGDHGIAASIHPRIGIADPGALGIGSMHQARGFTQGLGEGQATRMQHHAPGSPQRLLAIVAALGKARTQGNLGQEIVEAGVGRGFALALVMGGGQRIGGVAILVQYAGNAAGVVRARTLVMAGVAVDRGTPAPFPPQGNRQAEAEKRVVRPRACPRTTAGSTHALSHEGVAVTAPLVAVAHGEVQGLALAIPVLEAGARGIELPCAVAQLLVDVDIQAVTDPGERVDALALVDVVLQADGVMQAQVTAGGIAVGQQ